MRVVWNTYTVRFLTPYVHVTKCFLIQSICMALTKQNKINFWCSRGYHMTPTQSSLNLNKQLHWTCYVHIIKCLPNTTINRTLTKQCWIKFLGSRDTTSQLVTPMQRSLNLDRQLHYTRMTRMARKLIDLLERCLRYTVKTIWWTNQHFNESHWASSIYTFTATGEEVFVGATKARVYCKLFLFRTMIFSD